VGCGDIAQHADRAAESGDHEIHSPVVVEVSIGKAAVRGQAGEIGASRSAHIFKLPVTEIAKDGVRFGIVKMPGDFLDIVQHIAAGDHQVLPAVIVEIYDTV